MTHDRKTNFLYFLLNIGHILDPNRPNNCITIRNLLMPSTINIPKPQEYETSEIL